MNKAELVETVAAEVRLTKKDINNVVDAMTSAITNSLARGERVTLVGFGTFLVQKRKPRQGVNPRTGTRISILDKGIVGGNWTRAFLLGLDTLSREGNAAIAQVDTFLKYAEAPVLSVPSTPC